MYLQQFEKDNNILPFQTKIYLEDIRIETARLIKKELSLSSNYVRFFIFRAEITPEAQNALLKVIEEGENVHFLFCVQRADELLPTIHSRSAITNLDSEKGLDPSLLDSLRKAVSVDGLEGVLETEKLDAFLSALRHLMLTAATPEEARRYHTYCKRTLLLAPLADINNVNERIILEKIFSLSF